MSWISVDLYGCMACRNPLSNMLHTCSKKLSDGVGRLDFKKIQEETMKDLSAIDEYFKSVNFSDGIRAWEVDDNIYVAFDLPGCLLESIALQVEEKVITVKASGGKWGKVKWLYGKEPTLINKTFKLDVPYEPDSAIANYKNGVLEIRLNKKRAKDSPKYVKITQI